MHIHILQQQVGPLTYYLQEKDDSIVENGESLRSITSQSINIYSYSIPSKTYVSGASYSTNVNYRTNN